MQRLLKLIAIVAFLTTTNGCALDLEPTTLSLTNGGDADVYTNHRGWVRVEADGAPIALAEPMCMTPCGRPVGSVVCALGAELASVRITRPGESRSVEWDGTYYEINQERGCYRKRQRDAEFVAEFCYSHEYEQYGEGFVEDSDDQIWDANIFEPTCERVSFERGDDVELIVD